MANKNGIDNIYSVFSEGLGASIRNDAFCQYFLRCLDNGSNKMGITQKIIERKLEGEWLDRVEAALIPLDNIIRNPNRYIKNIEEVMPIELATSITSESIMHLAQHTDMIAAIDDDGMVTPERILNVLKEESLETYENRFIFTLLTNLDYFILRRLNLMNDGGKDVTEVTFSGESMVGREKVTYQLFISCEGRHRVGEGSIQELLHADVSQLTELQRVERIRRILNDFRSSPLIKELKDCAPVRPPLHMTNVLLRNPDFTQAVDLWNFISNYRGDSVETRAVERTLEPSQVFADQMISLVPVQYSIMKHHLGLSDIEIPDSKLPEEEHHVSVDPIKDQIEMFVQSAELDAQEVRKIFNDAIDRKIKEQQYEKTRVDNIITHIMDIEGVWLDRELQRLKNKKEKERRERMRILKEEKRKAEAERRAKAEAERRAREEAERLAREEAERRAIEEAERIAREEAERRAAEEAELNARIEAERRAKEEAVRKAREEAELRTKEDYVLKVQEAERAAREEAERVAREEAERVAREEAERVAREEAERVAREEAERVAREEAERAAREEAERVAREEAERAAREEAERVAREEAERAAREEAERAAREEAERVAREEAERAAREEAERVAREEAERVAHEEAEPVAQEVSPEEAERVAREEAERAAREEAERVAREEAEPVAQEVSPEEAEEAWKRMIKTMREMRKKKK